MPATVPSNQEIQEGGTLHPRFDLQELLPCITVDAQTGEVLMLAYMNEEAFRKTVETGKATYYSRSRKKLWLKGEESGFTQNVQEILLDCDQDAILLKVNVTGGACCHNGYRSCFYRKVKAGSADSLEFTMREKLFDPSKVYKRPNA